MNFPILLFPLSALVLNELDQTTTEVGTLNFNISLHISNKEAVISQKHSGKSGFYCLPAIYRRCREEIVQEKGFKEKILSNKCHTLLQSQYLFLAMMSGFY